MCSHIPNRNEQMVRYLGYYSNVLWEKRHRLREMHYIIPCFIKLKSSWFIRDDFRSISNVTY